jgi:uncharacterized membrane protein
MEWLLKFENRFLSQGIVIFIFVMLENFKIIEVKNYTWFFMYFAAFSILAIEFINIMRDIANTYKYRQTQDIIVNWHKEDKSQENTNIDPKFWR